MPNNAHLCLFPLVFGVETRKISLQSLDQAMPPNKSIH